MPEKQDIIEHLSGFINEERLEKLQNILAQRSRYITVVLEDIYQAQNASAVVRTSECLGLQELHIIENRNQYVVNKDVVQGASKWIEINRYNNAEKDNISQCINQLKKRGYKIVATTLSNEARTLPELNIDKKMALCFGSEELGLSQQTLELADEHMIIPMQGFTQSFNISVSAAICLYQLYEKIRQSELDWQLEQEDKEQLMIDWLIKSTPNGEAILENFLKTAD